MPESERKAAPYVGGVAGSLIAFVGMRLENPYREFLTIIAPAVAVFVSSVGEIATEYCKAKVKNIRHSWVANDARKAAEKVLANPSVSDSVQEAAKDLLQHADLQTLNNMRENLNRISPLPSADSRKNSNKLAQRSETTVGTQNASSDIPP